MKNYLIVDIGNSYIKIGLFKKNDELIHKVLIKTKIPISIKELKKIISNNFLEYKIDNSIIGSVVPKKTQIFFKIIKELFSIESYLLTEKTKTKFVFENINRKEIGDDIIALTEFCAHNSSNALGFSFGTAMFAIYLNENKLVGATIAPGIGTSFSKLLNKASLINIDKINKYSLLNYGNDTLSALESGFNNVRKGFVLGIYHSIVKKENKKIYCVISGGESHSIDVDFEYEINENAILLGFKYIYELNN